MALMRLTQKPARIRGEDPAVTVEIFVTRASQEDLACDLEEDGLHNEALVLRTVARQHRKIGKQAWWQYDGTMISRHLPDTLWKVWLEMLAQKRNTALACVY